MKNDLVFDELNGRLRTVRAVMRWMLDADEPTTICCSLYECCSDVYGESAQWFRRELMSYCPPRGKLTLPFWDLDAYGMYRRLAVLREIEKGLHYRLIHCRS